MWYFWLILAGIFVIAEIATVGFLIFWLSLGSLCAMLTSFFTDNIIIQTAVFVVTSVLFIFLTRPLAKKLAKTDNTLVTNAFSIIGKKAIVIKEINPTLGVGQIKIDGQVWTAKSTNEEIISEGTEVLILNIDGVKAVVSTDLTNLKIEQKV
ncbi:MAG: NfeD family protein [Clostridiales bacterium]|mgnify:FL=1|jgi:membrane protein implicated in regulation of membrane protease activity|nr:nodulation efficiency protein D [Clostridium sp. CAG:567]